MLAILPIFIYLLIVKLLDNFTIVSWRMLGISGMMGMMAAVVAMAIDQLLQSSGIAPDVTQLFPLIEELLKGLCILYLMSRRKILFFAEALCYGVAIGAGFALLENCLYDYLHPEITWQTEAFRGLGTALLHMGCSALFAVTALSVSRYLAIVPAFVVHYLYNLFLLPEYVQLITTILLFLTLFVCISIYNERRITQWMDDSIIDDIRLLVAIREGRLADTPAGHYLLTVKEHFEPELFFDMICYMQLYLELLIKGKSGMLLEQEGIDLPLTDEETKLRASMKTELRTLQHRIGYMGRQMLRPILRYNREDLKIIG